MNSFVLIVLVSTLYNGVQDTAQTVVHMQEFSSLQRCQAAGEWIKSNAIPVKFAGLDQPVSYSCKPQ